MTREAFLEAYERSGLGRVFDPSVADVIFEEITRLSQNNREPTHDEVLRFLQRIRVDTLHDGERDVDCSRLRLVFPSVLYDQVSSASAGS